MGPWNAYEVVDGHLKDDKVGVRLIADGPEGAIFGPQEFEALPNYLISSGATVEEVKE